MGYSAGQSRMLGIHERGSLDQRLQRAGGEWRYVQGDDSEHLGSSQEVQDRGDESSAGDAR